MMAKQWKPVADGEHTWSDREGISIRGGGAKLDAHVRPLEEWFDGFGERHTRLLIWESVGVDLPDHFRLCELVEADDPAPFVQMTPERIEAILTVLWRMEKDGYDADSDSEAGQALAVLKGIWKEIRGDA